jgi:glycosyltransferase involved in cell wall biosynthesis/DNA-binding SARP family transcriptional activator
MQNILEQIREKNMFFVLSTGRSGTKTIAKRLSELRDCLCLHEPAPQLILESSAYRYGRIENEKLRQLLLQTRQPVVNGKVYGESNQTLALIVPVLAKSFPKAKFIWLIRNGLDVVSSIFSRQWYTGHSANHDRYEDCPPLEKAWIDGRIRGDLCGDVPFVKWKKMNPFARCCWYWAYVNRTIENDLSDHCRVGSHKRLKLEELYQSLPEIPAWLGLDQTLRQKSGRHNRAHYTLYPWQKWSIEERKTFLYWCGPLMDRLYPDWRILSRGFFDNLNAADESLKGPEKSSAKSPGMPDEDNTGEMKSGKPDIYFTPQIKTHPKISVYITSYNQKAYLIEAVESALKQSLRPREIIIVDDCSTDNSQALIANYAQKYPDLISPIYHTKNLGVVRTRLDALNAVTGDYVTYVDGDDRFLPEKLEHEFEILAGNPKAQIVFSNNYYINPDGQPIGLWVEEEKPPQGYIFKETFGRRFPKNSLFRMELVNYQAWKAVGFHDPAITIYEDFDMRIRMTKHLQAAFCDEPLSEIRMHDKGLSKLEAKQHLASLEFIYHKNRSLLADLDAFDRKLAKNGFYDFVNNISRVAANQLAEKYIRKKPNLSVPLHDPISTSSKKGQANGQNELGSNLIFLISQPRAGSTLLQRVLAGHPEIHTTAEPWIMLHPLYALKEDGIIADYRADLAQQGLIDFLGQIPEGIELYKTALRKFGSTLYNRVLESSEKRFFLDKTPRYYHIIPELYSIFPEANFIFLLRNPIAVLSSVLKTWYGNRVAGLQIQTLIDLIKGPVRLLDGIKKLKEKAIVVEYESLVQSPEAVMLRVCNRIGIQYYEDMLDYGRKPKPKGRFGDPVGIYKHQRPVADSIDKWLKNISSPELVEFADQYLKKVGSDIVSKMGYNFEELKQKLDSQRRLWHSPQANIERVRILNKEGESLFANGDIDAAMNKLQKAFDLDPNDAETNNNLGVIYYHKGKKKTALRRYQKATELMPENITFQKNLAYFYYIEQGRVEEAMQIYIKVLNANSDDIETLLVLAHICVTLEKFDDAKYFSSRILKVEPKNKDAREFLEKLEKYELSDASGRLDPENNEDKTPDMQKRTLNQQREDLFAKGDLEGASEGSALKGKKNCCKPTSREQTIAITGSDQSMISVITPSLNQGQFIEQTIHSVLRQNYSNFQHIIIDGGSTDGTIEILKRYPHLKWISEKDSGQSEALNKGLRFAKGEIIGWINSDDWYEPGAFGMIASFFNASPTKNIVMGNCNLVDENGIIFDKVVNQARGFEELKKYWIGRSIPTQPAVFFRRKLMDQHGYVDETLHYAMDYDLWMRFAQKNHFYHLDVTVANYRFHQAAKGGNQDWNKFVPEWKFVSERYTKLPGSTPLVSIIIPCFNYAKYLCEAVESAILQSFQDFEIIIINDGSTDNTKEVAESLIAKYPSYLIRLINQKNSGQPAISRNRGILEANGEYILCLDADDVLLPTMLEKCLNVLEQDRSVAIAYTDRQDFDGVDQIVRAKNYNFSQLKYANHISYCALFRREVWDNVGGYRTNIKGCEDWDFWVAAGARGYFGRRIPEPLFKYRRHDTGVFQEVLGDYNTKFAQIILNNQEIYNDFDLNRAAIHFGKKTEIESDIFPSVSVIVPTLNRAEMLKEALKSILNQTYQNFEIIVVNDGGEDVFELIGNFQDPRVKCIAHRKNKGLAAARNTGIRNASGQYIALLDDDDIFYPEHLETAVDTLSKEIPVIYTDAVRAVYDRCGDDYRLIKKNVPYSIDFDRNKLLVGNLSPVNCFVFEKSLALEAGLFDETLSTLEDWDFWIRLSSLTSFKHIPKPTVQVNWRSDGTTMTSLLGNEFKKNRQKIYDKYRDEINQIPNVEKILNEFQEIWCQDWQVESPQTSIIILTCNQLQYTKKCIESIFQNTQESYELIFVDNGSTDGTVEYLESEVLRDYTDLRIRIIKNSENKGFAGGNNQGIAAASGDYILLLNNDVVVTPGWLKRLINCAQRNPQIGIVGPCSNYVSGTQLVKDVTYDLNTLAGLSEFSNKFADRFLAQAEPILRAVGFCMLIKRAVIDKIGGMDDRYGLGNFEDDDFSLRATIAGFESWIARDCFIHHFGHRTFIGEKVDIQNSLLKNWEVFKEKWGLPRELPYGSQYRLADLKNTQFDPSIHHYPLEKGNPIMEKSSDDFQTVETSYSLIHDSNNEKRPEEIIELIENFIESYPNYAVAHNDLGILYYSVGNKKKAFRCYEKAVQLDPGNLLFQKNLADFFFVELGRIEDALQIYTKIIETNPKDIEALLIAGHICVALRKFEDSRVFYQSVLELEPLNEDAKKNLDKLEKMAPNRLEMKSAKDMYQEIKPLLNNGDPHKAISSLKRLLQDFPDFALAHNDLGVLYYHIGNKEKSLYHYERAVELIPDNITFQKNLADFYCLELSRIEEALQIYVNILSFHPADVETLMATGQICAALEKPGDAMAFFSRILEIEPWNPDARDAIEKLERQCASANTKSQTPDEIYQNIKQNLNTMTSEEAIEKFRRLVESYPDFALGHNDLGVLHYNSGEKEKALHHYQLAAQLQPENMTFRKNLADFLFVELGRIEEALQIYVNILKAHPNDIETMQITGHICVALKKFDDARDLYLRVLELEPGNQDAMNNLQAIDKQQVQNSLPQSESLNTSTTSTDEFESDGLGSFRPKNNIQAETVSIIISLDGIQSRVKECIKSIHAHSFPKNEVILINKETTKDTLKWAKQLANDYRHYRIVECGSEGGWVESINLAIEKAIGDIIVIMHNDVVVSEGWLESFKMCLNLEPSIGVVGPISNRAANNQTLIDSEESDRAEYESAAKAFYAQNRYRRVPVRTLSDFCLAFRRELPEKIGYFDERFVSAEIGVKDFCERAASEGYQNLIAADTYIYHYDRHKTKINGSLERKLHNEDRNKLNAKFNQSEAQNLSTNNLRTASILRKADALSTKGEIDQAVEILLSGIGIKPEDDNLYLALAEILLTAKRFQEAKDALSEMPEHENPHKTGNQIEQPRLNAVSNANLFSRHFAMDHESKRNTLLAYAEEALENFETAHTHIERVLAVHPTFATALNLKGILSYHHQDRDSAEHFFCRAIESDPGYGEPYTNLGILRLADEQEEEGFKLIEKGFILNPSDFDIATNYHSLISGLNGYLRAEKLAREASILYPGNQKLRYMRIDCLVRLGKYNEAMEEIQTAIVQFGIEDGVLAAALKVREKLGVIKIKENSENCAVSLCMIVKDEEKNLAGCLASVKPIVDEMVVVDTGSTDRTKDIAKAFGAKVYDYDWNDDFAEARNYSISKAKGEWIFVMDADEVISPCDYDSFRKIVGKRPIAAIAYSIMTRNYNTLANMIGWTPNDGQYPEQEAAFGWLPSSKVRLFYGKDQVWFEGAVHEMVDPVLKRNGIMIKRCSIPIHHYGRLNKENVNRKDEVYFEIGKKKLEDMEDDINAIRELAVQATNMEKNEEALKLWRKLLTLNPYPKLISETYINMGTIYSRMGNYQNALEAAKKAIENAPELKEAKYNYAVAELHSGDLNKSISVLEDLLSKVPGYPPARFILAAAYCCAEDKETGLDGLNELKATPLGPFLVYSCEELTKGLIAAQRHDYALLVLSAAIECEIINSEIMNLFAECIRLREKEDNNVKNSRQASPDNHNFELENLRQ